MSLHSLRWLQKKLLGNESTLATHATSAAIDGTYPSSGAMGGTYITSAYANVTYEKA